VKLTLNVGCPFHKKMVNNEMICTNASNSVEVECFETVDWTSERARLAT